MSLPRQEVCAVRIGDFVFVAGGLLSTQQATATMEVYDLAQDSWSPAAPMPDARDHHAAAAVGGKLYVMGGFQADFHAKDQTWVYDPQSNQWSSRAPLPEARGGAWAVAFGDKIYLFGGANTSDVAQATTFIYDPALDSWTQGASMSTPREHTNAVRLGQGIHVIGGRAGPATGAHERYDPQSDSWQVLAPMPTARSAGAVAELDGRLYYMGGEIPMLFDVSEGYEPSTDRWFEATSMPLPRHGVAAVTLDDRILVPAGGVIQGLLPTAHVDSVVPAERDLGTPVCSPAVVNSTGGPGVLEVFGSLCVLDDDLALRASGLPPGPNIGYFLMGTGSSTFTPPGSAGPICVAPGLKRYLPPVENTTELGGGFVRWIGTRGPVSSNITVGSTWGFQAWHRDGMAPSNLTDARLVTFE
jgi:hypothetical protein